MDTIDAPLPFLEMIAKMAWQSRNAALSIAPLIIILVATFGVVKFYLGQSGDKIDLNKYLFYNIFMLFILINYAYVIDTTGSLTRIITGVFPRNESREMFKRVSDSKIAMNDYTKQGAQLDDMKRYDLMIEAAEKGGGITGWFQSAYFKAKKRIDAGSIGGEEEAYGWLDWLFQMMEVSFIRIIRALLELSRTVLMGFLIIVGPFALMFDMTPLMRGIASHWYKFFIAISLWLLTLNVLDAMYIGFAESLEMKAAVALDNSMMSEYRDTGYEYFSSQMEGLGGENGFLNLAMAIMYIMVPVLTTIYVGSGSGSEKLFGALWSGAMWAATKAGSSVRLGSLGGSGSGSNIKGKVSDNT